MWSSWGWCAQVPRRLRPGAPTGIPGRSTAESWWLLLDDREHVAGRENEVVLTRVLDLGAAVLAVDDDVTHIDVERNALAVVVDTTRTDRKDFALLGLLLGGVRDDQAGRRGLLGFERTDDDSVFERLDADRHVLTSPFTLIREVCGWM